MRTIVITGASSGIGAAAATQLAEKNERLILIGRSKTRTIAIAESIGAEYHIVDFERLDEVRDLATTLCDSTDRIDVLANNAGGIFAGPVRTENGFEKTFQVNHLAPFLLTNLLIDRLIRSKASVINTASVGARIFGNIDFVDVQNFEKFNPNKAYGDVKLANILFARELHRRYHRDGLSTVAFHPGVIATNFGSEKGLLMNRFYHSSLRMFLTSASKGGSKLAGFINGAPDSAWESGEYYRKPGKIGRTNSQAYDDALVQRHWNVSSEMLGISWPT